MMESSNLSSPLSILELSPIQRIRHRGFPLKTTLINKNLKCLKSKLIKDSGKLIVSQALFMIVKHSDTRCASGLNMLLRE